MRTPEYQFFGFGFAVEVQNKLVRALLCFVATAVSKYNRDRFRKLFPHLFDLLKLSSWLIPFWGSFTLVGLVQTRVRHTKLIVQIKRDLSVSATCMWSCLWITALRVWVCLEGSTRPLLFAIQLRNGPGADWRWQNNKQWAVNSFTWAIWKQAFSKTETQFIPSKNMHCWPVLAFL